MRQAAEGWFMKMIEVREQDEVDGRQVLDFQAGAFNALKEEEPVGKIGVNENVQVGELNEERRMADPSDVRLRQVSIWETRGSADGCPVRVQSSGSSKPFHRKRCEGCIAWAGVRSLNDLGRGWLFGRGGLGMFVLVKLFFSRASSRTSRGTEYRAAQQRRPTFTSY